MTLTNTVSNHVVDNKKSVFFSQIVEKAFQIS